MRTTMDDIDKAYEAMRFLTHNQPRGMKELQEYERHSPEFSALVANLTQLIMQLQMSPSEVRQAAMYACWKAELLAVRPTFMQAYMRERDR